MPHSVGYRHMVLDFENPETLLHGLDERHGGLLIPLQPGLSAGDRIMAEFGFKNRPQRFALRATVRWVRQTGTELLPPGVALDAHKDDVSKLRKLAAWARGEKVPYIKRRHVRYPTELACGVRVAGAEAEAMLLDVSEGGAFVSKWDLPSIGSEVEVKVRPPGALLSSKFLGRVMWLDFFDDSRGFGVQFKDPSQGRLGKLLDRVRGQPM